MICAGMAPDAIAGPHVRAVRPGSGLPHPQTMLWIGAHPDDETVAAPLLAFWCRDAGVKCTFLTLTRGEAGHCTNPQFCQPDLPSARSAEAASSSQYFHADLILLSFADGGGSADNGWGDRSSVLGMTVRDQVAKIIAAVAPDLVLTLDPRHGTTCHPDHRAVAGVVYDAWKNSGGASSLYYLETVARVQASDVTFATASNVSGALTFDANRQLPSTGAPAWLSMVDVMRRYPSQFEDWSPASVERTPPASRTTAIEPAFAPSSSSSAPCEQ